MVDIDTMVAVVRSAWSGVPAPPAADLVLIASEWGEEAARAFVGVAPVDVDISSPGFLVCTPLLIIPPTAAAAYLGTYMLGMLRGLWLQERTGLFHDVLTRAHLLHCLSEAGFWTAVVGPHLRYECRDALNSFCSCIVLRAGLLRLSPDESAKILGLATATLSL